MENKLEIFKKAQEEKEILFEQEMTEGGKMWARIFPILLIQALMMLIAGAPEKERDH